MESSPNEKTTKKNKNVDPYLFSNSLIFDENIDKLWLHLRDLTTEVKNIDFIDDFKFIKGNNTWTVGNKFSVYWVGVCNIDVKCVNVNVERTRKKIKWKLKLSIGIRYYKTLILYRITQNKKTLVKNIITRTEKRNGLIDFNQTKDYYTSLQKKILQEQKNSLQNIQKDIILYESCVINKNHLQVWNLLTDFQKIPIFTDCQRNVQYKGLKNEVGSFVRYYDEKLKRNVFLKIIKCDIPEKRNCWTFSFQSIGTNCMNIPKLIEIKVININENKTQISILHEFAHNSNPDYMKEFIIYKKKVIKEIFDYFTENQDECLINSGNDSPENNVNINI